MESCLKIIVLRSEATKNLVVQAKRFFASLRMTVLRRLLGQSPEMGEVTGFCGAEKYEHFLSH